LIADRLRARDAHFMPPGLLESQFKTLEEPTEDERPVVVDIDATVDEIADRIVTMLNPGRTIS
jgi:gluconokinase